MSNPFFNEKKMNEDAAGWAVPTSATAVQSRPDLPTTGAPPLTDGPVSTWKPAMTVNGVITAAGVLLVLLVVSATFGWMSSEVSPDGEFQMPAFAMLGIVIGFGAVIASYFKPNLAKFLGPIYSLCYGYAVGAISRAFEYSQNGIVLQAVLGTIAVFFVMLVMYRTGIVKVTPGYRKVVVAATLGVMLLYVVSFIMSLFGASIPFLNSPSLLGIGFSVLVCALAAANLALDFDLVDRGVAMKMSKDYEWVAALGLVVTLVWLYLELLRLLSKLNRS